MNDDEKRAVLDGIANRHAEDCPAGQMARAAARQYGARADRGTASGPAQVATEEYRTHYDTIFGRKAPVPEA